VAATVGVAAGTAWAILLAIVTGSVNELAYHLVCFPLGLGITAIIVFYLRHCPEDKMDETPRLRWYRLTPSWLILGLLVVECLLWLSERFQWFAFTQHKGWTVLFAVASVGIAIVLMLLWFVIALIFRRRFQFGIRSLLVLTVVVAIPFSWLAVEMKAAREQGRLVNLIRTAGRQVEYDFQLDARLLFLANTQPQGPKWLHSSLGVDFFADIVLVGSKPQMGFTGVSQLNTTTVIPPANDHGTDIETAALLAIVKDWHRLRWLDLEATQTTDPDLENLRGLAELEWLSLENTQITDTGLKSVVATCPKLRRLDIGRTRVTDDGLQTVGKLTYLQSLWLGDLEITDVGLEHLKVVRGLTRLWLNGTRVTKAGVDTLHQTFPNCFITAQHLER